MGFGINDYVIGASAAAMAHGFPTTNDDLDLWLRPKVFKEKRDMFKIKDGKYTDKVTEHIDVGIVGNRGFFNFDDAFKHSCIIKGHRFLNLNGLEILYTKLVPLLNKPKHKEILDWIKQKKLSLKLEQSFFF